MICSDTRTRSRRVSALAIAALFSTLAPQLRLGAQSTTSSGAEARDTTARRDSARSLERVMISAVREAAAPISQKTLSRVEIQRQYFGQDVPLLLQGTTPSLTSYAETGNYWGYSYIRLRGLDQSRINITLDGIPLNDPEDQVLYFADFPDLSGSLQSIQVQRGVGTSSNGTASYAGSINMETTSLAAAKRGGAAQVEAGSFGSLRGSLTYDTGLLDNGFAVSARASSLHTDGYRYHSGVNGQSGFLSAGYFGERDILKATLVAGAMQDTMAYLAVPVADLDTNRRINPLSPQERDGFGERLAALSYTRLLGAGSSFTTTVYRLAATGDYNVLLDSLETLHLDFVSYGVTSAWSLRREGLSLDLGFNADSYARDHYAYMHPEMSTALYFNTSRKRDQAAFAKAAYTVGATTIFGDAQVRHATFSYMSDTHSGIAGSSISWTFLNPKVGLTYRITQPFSLYASYGKTSREPARSDMFAGFDNLDTSNVAFIGPFSRVKPETVHDVEAGANYRTGSLQLQANLYSMDFRNQIAPIGALSYIGNPLFRNVASSYRRGIEADVSYTGLRRWQFNANATGSMNRIRQYTDSSADVPVTYNNVEPLLTPRFQSFGRVQYALTGSIDLAAQARYQSVSFLTNTSDRRYVLPADANLDASLSWRLGRNDIMIRANNLTNSRKYGSGYESGGESCYYVLPPRNVFVSLKLAM